MRLINHFVVSLLVAAGLTAGSSAMLPAGLINENAKTYATDRPAENEKNESGYLRIVDERGEFVALEIASRTFTHEDPNRPVIGLISVAHIADQSFFDAIQDKLDGYDLVLYEAVAPAGVRPGRGGSQKEKIQSAQQSMTFVASIVERYRQRHHQYPSDYEALLAYVAELDPVVRNWFLHSIVDPWGQRLMYERVDEGQPGYELFSLGPSADGEADDANGEVIRFDAHHQVRPLAREESNLQKQLAEALKLAYQLESLRYDQPHWRISDMTAEQLFAAFGDGDVDVDFMAGAVAGGGLPARLIGMLLRMMRTLDAMYDGAVSDMVKVIFIEILGDGDLVMQSMEQMSPDFTRVIINERNQIVMDDLKAILDQEQEQDVESIAILYGAAHMPDFEQRLDEQLGYTASDRVWLPAITVDLEASSVDERQLAQMRMMIRRMLQTQMRPRR